MRSQRHGQGTGHAWAGLSDRVQDGSNDSYRVIRIAGSRSTEEDASVRLRYTIEVSNLGQLARALTLIREVRAVARPARR